MQPSVAINETAYLTINKSLAQLAAKSWRSRFGRPTKIDKIGEVVGGQYCKMPDDWLQKKIGKQKKNLVLFIYFCSVMDTNHNLLNVHQSPDIYFSTLSVAAVHLGNLNFFITKYFILQFIKSERNRVTNSGCINFTGKSLYQHHSFIILLILIYL